MLYAVLSNEDRTLPEIEPSPDSRIEEKLAHLERSVAELSDVVARQDRALDRLANRVEMLMHREAQRESDAGGGVVLGDEKPPHW